jgi:plastocyanin
MRRFLTTFTLGAMVLASATVISEAGLKAKDERAGAAVSSAAQNRVTVKISNFQFNPKEVTVTAGTVVEWVNEAGRHTVVADNGAFKSDVLTAGGKFEHKFDKVGTYPYHCGFHGGAGGKDMAGTVIVKK